MREQVEAIERWYRHDWMALDPKIRTSIVEGISGFLSLFDHIVDKLPAFIVLDRVNVRGIKT